MLPKKEAQRSLGVLSFPPLEFVLNVGCVGWVYLNPSETLCLECKGWMKAGDVAVDKVDNCWSSYNPYTNLEKGRCLIVLIDFRKQWKNKNNKPKKGGLSKLFILFW